MFLLTNEEKRFLLRLARKSLEAAVCGEMLDVPLEYPASLAVPGSAFVTLHLHSRLRGCVGYVHPPLKPLYQTVIDAAAAAALRDTRFPQVRPSELTDIEIEISVLSPSWEVRPDGIQVGVHGLIVSKGWERGLLLPQVAIERQWTSSQFLKETCRKAGLSPDAWQHGAKIEVFTAEVFSERALAADEMRS